MSRNRGRQLTATEAAALAGMSVKNWDGYRSRGVPRGNPVPDPDDYLGRTPWWWESTVRAWMDRRPGSPPQLRQDDDVKP